MAIQCDACTILNTYILCKQMFVLRHSIQTCSNNPCATKAHDEAEHCLLVLKVVIDAVGLSVSPRLPHRQQMGKALHSIDSILLISILFISIFLSILFLSRHPLPALPPGAGPKEHGTTSYWRAWKPSCIASTFESWALYLVFLLYMFHVISLCPPRHQDRVIERILQLGLLTPITFSHHAVCQRQKPLKWRFEALAASTSPACGFSKARE